MSAEILIKLFNKAVNFHKQQNIVLAKKFYQIVLSIDPSFNDAWQNISLLYRNEGSFQKVIDCGKICSIMGGNVMLQTFASSINASMELKKADDYSYFLKKYFEHGGDKSSVLGFCSLMLDKLGPSAEVIDILSKLRPEENYAEEANFLLGFAHALMEDYRSAAKHFKEVVKINPHNSRAQSLFDNPINDRLAGVAGCSWR